MKSDADLSYEVPASWSSATDTEAEGRQDELEEEWHSEEEEEEEEEDTVALVQHRQWGDADSSHYCDLFPNESTSLPRPVQRPDWVWHAISM